MRLTDRGWIVLAVVVGVIVGSITLLPAGWWL